MKFHIDKISIYTIEYRGLDHRRFFEVMKFNPSIIRAMYVIILSDFIFFLYSTVKSYGLKSNFFTRVLNFWVVAMYEVGKFTIENEEINTGYINVL